LTLGKKFSPVKLFLLCGRSFIVGCNMRKGRGILKMSVRVYGVMY